MSSLVNLVSGTKSDNSVETHFMSESGIIDMFVLMGPKPKDAIRQYASLTGVAPLPQVNIYSKPNDNFSQKLLLKQQYDKKFNKFSFSVNTFRRNITSFTFSVIHIRLPSVSLELQRRR